MCTGVLECVQVCGCRSIQLVCAGAGGPEHRQAMSAVVPPDESSSRILGRWSFGSSVPQVSVHWSAPTKPFLLPSCLPLCQCLRQNALHRRAAAAAASTCRPTQPMPHTSEQYESRAQTTPTRAHTHACARWRGHTPPHKRQHASRPAPPGVLAATWQCLRRRPPPARPPCWRLPARALWPRGPQATSARHGLGTTAACACTPAGGRAGRCARKGGSGSRRVTEIWEAKMMWEAGVWLCGRQGNADRGGGGWRCGFACRS